MPASSPPTVIRSRRWPPIAALLRCCGANFGGVDPHEVGRQMQAMILTYLDRLVAFDQSSTGKIAHVDYPTAVDRPEVAVAQASPRSDIEMSPASPTIQLAARQSAGQARHA